MVWASFPAFAVGYFTPNLQHSGVYHTTGQGRKRHYHGIWWIIRPAPTNSFRAGFFLIHQEENTTRVLMTIDGTVECAVRHTCFPPGSRPRSRCLPCVLHLPVVHCCCATDAASTRPTRSVLCLP